LNEDAAANPLFAVVLLVLGLFFSCHAGMKCKRSKNKDKKKRRKKQRKPLIAAMRLQKQETEKKSEKKNKNKNKRRPSFLFFHMWRFNRSLKDSWLKFLWQHLVHSVCGD